LSWVALVRARQADPWAAGWTYSRWEVREVDRWGVPTVIEAELSEEAAWPWDPAIIRRCFPEEVEAARYIAETNGEDGPYERWEHVPGDWMPYGHCPLELMEVLDS
jgi:hypothetical protein